MLTVQEMRSFVREIVSVHSNEGLLISMDDIDDLSRFEDLRATLEMTNNEVIRQINKKLRKAFKAQERARLRAIRREVFK